jgi:hypothetical protein
MQLTDWLLVEVALLFIGLTQISLTKAGLTTRLQQMYLSGCRHKSRRQANFLNLTKPYHS